MNSPTHGAMCPCDDCCAKYGSFDQRVYAELKANYDAEMGRRLAEFFGDRERLPGLDWASLPSPPAPTG